MMEKRRPIVWVLGGAVIVVAAYILAWQWDFLPREVIVTGTIHTPDGKTLKTRQYYRSSRQEAYKFPGSGSPKRDALWEVQFPSGRWVDCAGSDCLAASRRPVN